MSHDIHPGLVLVMIAAAFGCFGNLCPSEPPPSYGFVGIRAEHEDGTPVSGDAASACVPLPVLHGAVVEQDLSVEGDVRLTVIATTAELRLRFEGTLEPRERINPSSHFDVTALDGTELRMILTDGCEAPSDGNGGRAGAAGAGG
jgi:hypothetical protein